MHTIGSHLLRWYALQMAVSPESSPSLSACRSPCSCHSHSPGGAPSCAHRQGLQRRGQSLSEGSPFCSGKAAEVLDVKGQCPSLWPSPRAAARGRQSDAASFKIPIVQDPSHAVCMVIHVRGGLCIQMGELSD